MLTIKKRGRRALAIVAAACLLLTACGPPGPRALKKSDRLVQSGKFDEAIATLTPVTNLLAGETKQVQARAYNILGLAYHGIREPQPAFQFYLQALALDRNLAAVDYNLGCLELEQTNLPAARDYLLTYTTLCAMNLDGYLKLGKTQLHLAMQTPIAAERIRQLDAAKKAYDSANRVKVTPEACNNIGLIELQRSIEARRNDKPSPEAVTNAVIRFNMALKHDSGYGPALLNLAIVYDKYLNDPHQALKFYGQYLQIEPLPPHTKEVALLMTNLDRSTRFGYQGPGHAADLPPALNTPGGMTFIPKAPSRPATNAGITATNSAQPVPGPPPGPPPVKTTQTPVANASETTSPNSAASHVESNTKPAPVAGTGAFPAENAAPADTAPAHKPSRLNPLNWFGGKTKSETAAGEAVTPLPPAHPVIHYTPPPEMILQPGNRAEAERLAQQAAVAEKDARWKEAIGIYRAAVKADPTCFEASVGLGMVAIKSEDFGSALEALNQALTIKPDSADARYGYAWALEKKTYFQDAANELEKLLAQHPNEVRAHLLVGNLYAQQLGQPDYAREHYKKVLETDPHNPQATAIRFWLQGNAGP